MGYNDWEVEYRRTVSAPKGIARLANLLHETRIDPTKAQFAADLGNRFRSLVNSGQSAAEASVQALDQAIGALGIGSPLLKALPANRAAVPAGEWLTHEPVDAVSRFYVDVPLNLADPPPSVRLTVPLKHDRAGRCLIPFIWVTWDPTPAGPLPTDAHAVARDLGLAHYVPGTIVYRIVLPRRPAEPCFIPTCLDARLYEAWAPPPDAASAASPWGFTRNLETGASTFPELVIPAEQRAADRPHGDRLSGAVGNLRIDYLVGRGPI